MKLRKTTFVYLVLLAFVIMGIQILAANYRAHDMYDSLERDMIVAELRKSIKKMQTDLLDLDSLLEDLPTWDEASQFVRDRNDSFLLFDASMEDFDHEMFHLVAVFDEQDRIVSGAAIDRQGRKDHVLLLGIQHVIAGLDLPHLPGRSGVGALLMMPQGALLFVKAPLRASQRDDRVRGSVIMAKIVDWEYYHSLSSQLEQRIFAHQIPAVYPNEQSRIVPLFDPSLDITITTVGEDKIQAQAVLNSLNNIPAYLLAVEGTRFISLQGRRGALVDSLFLAAVVIVFCVLIVWFLHRKVLSRLDRLTVEVRRLDLSNVAGGSVTVEGTDEIAELAEDVNAMLGRIADDRAKLQDAQHQLEGQVAKRTAELAKANRDLLVLDKAKTEFLSSTSHELRTPLTAIRGFVKLLMRTFDKQLSEPLCQAQVSDRLLKRYQSNFQIVLSETERLRELVDDLLDLNKLVAGSMEWNNADIEAADIVQQVVELMSMTFRDGSGVALDVKSEVRHAVLHVDSARICQVLSILLANAAKCTVEGRVEFRLRMEGADAVRFSVTDGCGGISEEDLGQVFEIFYRIQSGGELTGAAFGSGLGLPLSKGIIEHYGGSMSVESRTGEGSVFSFVLPLKP